MKRYGGMIAILIFSTTAQSSLAATAPGVQIPIWPGAAPGSEYWTLPETRDAQMGHVLLKNISQPTITLFPPAPGTSVGTAIIYCEGGGFRALPDPTQSNETITTLQGAGVTVFVLKYRTLQNTPEEQEYIRTVLSGTLDADRINRDLSGEYMKSIRKLASDDGRQAVRYVRQHAADLGIKPDRIGMIGFSSGGVIDTMVAVDSDTDSRPDFVGTFYGSPPDEHIVIPNNAPPQYIATVSDDALTWKGALRRYEEWRQAGRRVELHIYGEGGHGFSRGKPEDTVERWRRDFIDWLRQEAFL